MENRWVKIIILLILPGIFLTEFSCKMQSKEEITIDSPKDNSIRLSDAQIQLANINIAETREGSLGRNLILTGVLKVNEQTKITISSRIPGRIEKLFFKNTGENVRKGDSLYEFYSEELVSAQREYFTLQSNNWNFSGKYEPSLELENKLLIMGMIPSQIQQLRRDGKILFRVTIYSPAAGKIRAINVSEGQYTTAGQTLYELAGDDNLWVEAQVYPDEIQSLKTGMPATAIIPAAEEMKLKCNISFINPSFERGRNVTLVRAVIKNPDYKLHPGMFAMLNVQTNTSYGIVVPASSIITGIDGDRIWIREEDGAFSVRKVTSGLQSDDSVLVLSGIDQSDKIVTSGAYLLNSELKLKQGEVSDPGTGLLTTTAEHDK